MGTLSQLLNTSMTSKIGSDDQGPWRQFVLDHLDYISQRTVPYTVDKLLINQYRYDLTRFLKETLGIMTDMTWIVQLLNDLSSDMAFHEPGDYIIPSDNLINQLYHSFTTNTANSR